MYPVDVMLNYAIASLPLTGFRVLQVGTGAGDCIPYYEQRGLDATFIEGDSLLIAELTRKYPDAQLIHGAVSNKAEKRTWYRMNYPACSSLHDIDPAIDYTPKIFSIAKLPVECTTVDYVTADLPHFQFLVVDVQGHDYEVLEGAERTLRNCLGVCCEVWHKALYKGSKYFHEVAGLMQRFGFRILTCLHDEHPEFYGDAIFVRE